MHPEINEIIIDKGVRVYIGVGDRSSFIHGVRVTAGNAHDLLQQATSSIAKDNERRVIKLDLGYIEFRYCGPAKSANPLREREFPTLLNKRKTKSKLL